MILVDTSVWIDHFRAGEPVLANLLRETRVLMHPAVRGELALGHLAHREETLTLLGKLPASEIATDTEVLAFIDAHGLSGSGIGYVDAHLLAGVSLSLGARFWTRDRRLGAVAERLGLAYQE
jgi:predicted nucleic acid-binding protein